MRLPSHVDCRVVIICIFISWLSTTSNSSIEHSTLYKQSGDNQIILNPARNFYLTPQIDDINQTEILSNIYKIE